MRALILILGIVFLADCAATPGRYSAENYDRKYNETLYVADRGQSEFVGTSAKAPARKPSWYRFGHP